MTFSINKGKVVFHKIRKEKSDVLIFDDSEIIGLLREISKDNRKKVDKLDADVIIYEYGRNECHLMPDKTKLRLCLFPENHDVFSSFAVTLSEEEIDTIADELIDEKDFSETISKRNKRLEFYNEGPYFLIYNKYSLDRVMLKKAPFREAILDVIETKDSFHVSKNLRVYESRTREECYVCSENSIRDAICLYNKKKYQEVPFTICVDCIPNFISEEYNQDIEEVKEEVISKRL
jgi:hypothetical protein